MIRGQILVARGVNFCSGRKAIPALSRARWSCLPDGIPGWLRIGGRAAVLGALLAHAGCSTLPTSGPTNALASMDRFDPASGLRSMSRSTGFTATAVAGLILDGTLKEPGGHAPEALGARPGILDRVLDHLRARGVRCEMFAGS